MNKDRRLTDSQSSTKLNLQGPAISTQAARTYEAPCVLSVELLEVFASSCIEEPFETTPSGKVQGAGLCAALGS